MCKKGRFRVYLEAHSFIQLFVEHLHSFISYLLSTCFASVTMPGTGDINLAEEMNSCPHRTLHLEGIHRPASYDLGWLLLCWNNGVAFLGKAPLLHLGHSRGHPRGGISISDPKRKRNSPEGERIERMFQAEKKKKYVKARRGEHDVFEELKKYLEGPKMNSAR